MISLDCQKLERIRVNYIMSQPKDNKLPLKGRSQTVSVTWSFFNFDARSHISATAEARVAISSAWLSMTD